MWPHSKNGQPTIRDNGYSPQKPNKSNTKDVKMFYLGILGLLSSFSLKKNGLYKYKNKNWMNDCCLLEIISFSFHKPSFSYKN